MSSPLSDVPKVELHVHLDGAFDTELLYNAAKTRLAELPERISRQCAACADVHAFEALVTGRSMHDGSQPSGIARRLFPAQVIKSCSMAHTVSRILDGFTTATRKKRPRRPPCLASSAARLNTSDIL